MSHRRWSYVSLLCAKTLPRSQQHIYSKSEFINKQKSNSVTAWYGYEKFSYTFCTYIDHNMRKKFHPATNIQHIVYNFQAINSSTLVLSLTFAVIVTKHPFARVTKIKQHCNRMPRNPTFSFQSRQVKNRQLSCFIIVLDASKVSKQFWVAYFKTKQF